MVNIFDINDIRSIIFDFVYPKIIKKGMTIKIVKSQFHPFLTGKIEKIYSIKKCDNYFVITLLNKSKKCDIFWFKVETYLYTKDDNVLKVLKS